MLLSEDELLTLRIQQNMRTYQVRNDEKDQFRYISILNV